jgi:tRNA-specific 2-thiouridylase
MQNGREISRRFVPMRVRALGSFSGGLDGMVAASVLRSQGIDVELVTFESPFFSSRDGEEAAARLGLPWRELDFTHEIMELLEDPPSGFGKNLNPCIDCHARMFRTLGRIAGREGFDFIFSGEVLGQRPMSQNRNSLNRVARLSGYGHVLLRPLSARLLPETAAEEKGLVDRNRLLDISGRGRKRQVQLAEGFGFTYRNPGGGCLLTEPNYCSRLKVLMEIPGLMTPRRARLVRYGRFFRLSCDTVCLVGRSEEDNAALESLVQSEPTYSLEDAPGPTGVLLGDSSMLPELEALVRRYAGIRD